MEKIAKYGHVWKHKTKNTTHGPKIDIKTIEELSEYEQVPRDNTTMETNPETPKEETPYFTPKSRRSE